MQQPFHLVSCSLYRDGVRIQTGIKVQIDPMSLEEAADIRMEDPYDAYEGYITGQVYDIRRNDVLVDETTVNMDAPNPDTGQARTYVVMGEPNTYYEDLYTELLLHSSVGL